MRPAVLRDPFYRAQDIGCPADRRQSEIDRPFAAWHDGAVETEPQCRRIAGKGKFEGLAGQCWADQQNCRTGSSRTVALCPCSAPQK